MRNTLLHSTWLVFLFSATLGASVAKGQNRVGVADSILLAGLVQLEYGAVLPLADLSDRFGIHNDIGLQISIKNRKNLVLGAGMQFYFGTAVREDSILKPLENDAGFIIGTDGFQYVPNLNMRGWSLSVHAGKVTSWAAVNPNSGIILLGGAGFIQHRIDLSFEKEFLPQLGGAYEKGYDRLTNGLFVRQYIGYLYSGSERFLNIRAGLEFTESLTASRRDVNLDTGQIPSGNRLDIQAALKVAWVLPIYENPKLQYYYN
ncbi:MAG: hypothetical protein GC205_08405 [Bacteroidetes bacterium]|nr:hypothetical protein [Bacteroidota bacterium]